MPIEIETCCHIATLPQRLVAKDLPVRQSQSEAYHDRRDDRVLSAKDQLGAPGRLRYPNLACLPLSSKSIAPCAFFYNLHSPHDADPEPACIAHGRTTANGGK